MKTLKYIHYKRILVLMVVSLLSAACQDSIDDLRDNPNGVTEIDDAALFTKAVRSLFQGTYDEGSYRFAGQHAHYYVAGSNARLPDQYTDGFDGAYNAIMRDMYGGVIRHIEDVLEITSTEGTANSVRYAMADVIAVMGYARITDGFGEVPYVEGGKGKVEGILFPEYDTQEFIYKDLIERLTASIAVLKTADPAMGYPNSDPVFNNDISKWVRFANSVRLRLAMRLRLADNALSQQVVGQCLQDPLMEDNSHNAWMIETEGQGNAWYLRKTGYPRIKMSEMIIDLLASTSDPRLPVFVSKNGDDVYAGQLNGLTDAAFGASNFDTKSNMGDALSSPMSKLYLMTATEIYFLRAEAALAYDNDAASANDLYQMGIQTSLDQWEVDAASIANYMSGPSATLSGSDEDMEEQIGTQMWLAITPNYYESWCHIRRTGYPVIEQRTEDYLNAGVTNGYMPSRFKYSVMELSSNNANVTEAINRQGPNEIYTPVWWDKN